MSPLDRRPFSLVFVMDSDLLEHLLDAPTFMMPFTSISKATSIWGTPRGARDGVELELSAVGGVLGRGMWVFILEDP